MRDHADAMLIDGNVHDVPPKLSNWQKRTALHVRLAIIKLAIEVEHVHVCHRGRYGVDVRNQNVLRNAT